MTIAQTLHIGTAGKRRRFGLPLDVATQTLAILAKRGVGKTHTAVVLVEGLLEGGQQVIAVDPLDVWWGLRSSKDGKRAGLPVVVFGGEKGDLPIADSDGGIIADLLVEQRISAVLSLRHLSKSAQRRFVADFAERLYERKAETKHRTPLHLVLDEADAFCPQRVYKGAERMVGAIDDLVRRGRASGVGVTLITQRSAAIHKDVLTQTEVLVCLRTVSPQDRKAVEAWIEAHDAGQRHDEFMGSLAGLPIGAAWFWSPGWLDVFELVEVRDRKTFDSSATPTVGAPATRSAKLADVDIEALRGKLRATIDQAKANDPVVLKRRIRELEGRVVSKATASPTIDVAAVDRAVAKRDCHWRGEVDRLQRTVATIRRKLKDVLQLVEADARVVEPAPARSPAASTPARPRPPVRCDVTRATPSSSELGKSGMRRMLAALVQHGAMAAGKLSILTGIAATGGTFRTYLGRLKTLGLVEGDRQTLRATPEGVSALGDYEPLPTGEELLDYWRERLGQSGMRSIFDVLVQVWPRSLSRDDVADRTGIAAAGGTFRTYVGKLKTLRLIQGTGELKASDELFTA